MCVVMRRIRENPIIGNIMKKESDEELERREHRFVLWVQMMVCFL